MIYCTRRFPFIHAVLYESRDTRPNPYRQVEMLGGPMDGRIVTLHADLRAVRFPVLQSRGAVFVGEHAADDIPRFEYTTVEYEQVPGEHPDLWHPVTDTPRRVPLTPADTAAHFQTIPTRIGAVLLSAAFVLPAGVLGVALAWLWAAVLEANR